jgi:hypothetical protein
LFQEYDFEIIVNLGKLNVGPDHLSRILSGEDAGNINDSLLNAHLFTVQMVFDYFKDIMKLLSTGMDPLDMKVAQKK